MIYLDIETLDKGGFMKFYVYVLARPDNRVFYVGKGKGGRIYRHEWAARRGEQSHRSNIIRKIWANGGQVIRRKVFETDDEQEAISTEIGLISEYGRDILANLTDGGEGNSGWKPTPETIAKRAAALRGKKRTEEQRRRMSDARKGITHGPPSEGTRQKISQSQLGKPKPKHSEDERRRKSERQKGSKRPPVSEETRRKLSEAHKGKKRGAYSEERVRKALEGRSGKRRPDSPETKRRKSEAQRVAWIARRQQRGE